MAKTKCLEVKHAIPADRVVICTQELSEEAMDTHISTRLNQVTFGAYGFTYKEVVISRSAKLLAHACSNRRDPFSLGLKVLLFRGW